MNTTPSPTPPRSPARGRAGAGPAWRRIGRQRLGDRRHRRPARRRAGCDRGRPDHRDVGRGDGRGPDHQRDPGRAAGRHPCRCTCSNRHRSAGRRSRPGRRPTTWRERAGSSPPLRMRPTCAAGWARRRSTWRRRRTAPGPRGGARPSPPGCPVSTGRNERCSSRRSMPVTGEPVVFDRDSGVDLADAVAASCSSRRPCLPHRRQPVHRRRLPAQRERRPGHRVRAGAGAVAVRRPDTASAGVGHAARGTGRRTARRRQQRRDDLPRRHALSAFGTNMMDPSTRPPAARAGYDQGRARAGQLTRFWR